MSENIEPAAPEGVQDELISVKKTEYEETKKNLEKALADKTTVVEEIQELRKKKQEAEEKLQEALKKPEDPKPADAVTPDSVAETVESILARREQQTAKANREVAFRIFRERNKEFHDENDVGGIKWSALEAAFNRFNTSGLSTQEDFLQVLADAKRLMSKEEKKPEEEKQPIQADPDGGGAPQPKEVTHDSLTSKELAIIDRSFNGDKDRYLKIKANHPEEIERLLNRQY